MIQNGYDLYLSELETLFREYGPVISYHDYLTLLRKARSRDEAIARAATSCKGVICVLRRVLNREKDVAMWIDDGGNLPDGWVEIEPTVTPNRSVGIFSGSRRQCRQYLDEGPDGVTPAYHEIT